MHSFYIAAYFAVITIVCPFRSADFLEEVVRDGLATDCGNFRDVTVHHDREFSLPHHNKEGKQNVFAFVLA